jgi:hypothetical protein
MSLIRQLLCVKAVNLRMVWQQVLMLDVLVNKSYGIPDYILVLDTIRRKKAT